VLSKLELRLVLSNSSSMDSALGVSLIGDCSGDLGGVRRGIEGYEALVVGARARKVCGAAIAAVDWEDILRLVVCVRKFECGYVVL